MEHDELVPHSNENAVILYARSGQLVIYEKEEQRLILRNSTEKSDHCPMCGRAFHNSMPEPFMDKNYFRLLSFSSCDHLLQIPLEKSSLNQGYYERFFIEQKRLGRGHRGCVFLCLHVLNGISLGQFAVKKVPVGDRQEWLARMLQEVTLLEKLRHSNIVEYKHAWLESHQLTPFGPEIPCLFILMEQANGGNLEDYIELQWEDSGLTAAQRAKKERFRQEESQEMNIEGGIGYGPSGKRVRYLSQPVIWSFFKDICLGLQHLHQHGIIHRDLKPPNLLLHLSHPNQVPRILISDFGECEFMSEIQQAERTGATGTLEFMAPELLIQNNAGRFVGKHSPKADIWSLGMVLYYLCYSHTPFGTLDDLDAIRQEIIDFDWNFECNNERIGTKLHSIMAQLLQKDPEKRPNMDQMDYLDE